MKLIVRLVVFLAGVLIASSVLAQEEGVVVERIHVENNQRVESATVLSYLTFSEGKMYTDGWQVCPCSACLVQGCFRMFLFVMMVVMFLFVFRGIVS